MLTADEVLERSTSLAATLPERAARAEAERRLPAATIDDATTMDLWSMVVPTSLGGHGLGLSTLAQSTRILGRGCTASAWTLSFLIMHNWLLARFPAPARDELFTADRPWALAPAPLAPTGTLTPTAGGYTVTGRWEWATGVRHADWVMVHAVQTDPAFTTRFVLVPIGDVTVDDNWHTSGMRGTGSAAVVLDEVVVPAHRTVPAADLMSGSGALHGDGMAYLPVPPVLALIAAAPALGAAEAAVELFRARIAERVLAYSLGERAVEQPAAQIRLGTVISDLAAIRARWDAAIGELDQQVGRGDMTLDRRMACRLTAAATVRGARSIMTTIAEGAGASVYFTDSPFQRFQRDIEVLKGHVIFDWDRTTELAGKLALGLEPKPTDLI